MSLTFVLPVEADFAVGLGRVGVELEGVREELWRSGWLPFLPERSAVKALWERVGAWELLAATGLRFSDLEGARWIEGGLALREREVWVPQRLWGCSLDLPGEDVLLSVGRDLGLVARFAALGRVLDFELFRDDFVVRALESGVDLLLLARHLGVRDLRQVLQFLPMALGTCEREFAKCHPLSLGRRPAQADLEVDEVLAILAHPRRERDRLMLRTAYASGLRASEVTGLCFGDLRADLRLFVRGGKGGQDRYALLDTQTRSLLGEGKLEERVFPVSRSHFHRCVQRAALELGLANSEEVISPHTLRYACATHCYANGMSGTSLRRLLGHSEMDDTALYVRPDSARLARELKAAGWGGVELGLV